MSAPIEAWVRQAERDGPGPVYLVHGDLTLAEPVARRLAQALAQAAGCEVDVHRHPPQLGPILDDLRTFSMFASAKVVLAVDSALLADSSAAAGLVDDAAAVLPLPEGGGDLPPRTRAAAARLLQALRLFDLNPGSGEPAALVGELPDWALAGRKPPGKGRSRKRSAKEIRELREGLAGLLAAAREAGLSGWAEGDLAQLGEALRAGLPPGHSLVLAESSVDARNPVVAALEEAGRVADAGRVESQRSGGWQGLEGLVRELEGQTGAGIERRALEELARRTLRGGGRPGEEAEADSTARFAGEYRKLANLAPDGTIRMAHVEAAVEDRGQEDVFGILDAVGSGKPEEALDRLRRLLAGAADPIASRLAFFGLVASFCRHLTAVRGMMAVAGVPAGERSYPRFKSRWAPKLAAELPGGGKSPLAGLHPFRLHKAYLAACRLPEAFLAALPWAVLETELQLKGESTDPDGALARLLLRLATAGAT